MRLDQAREVLAIVLDIETTLDRLGTDVAWMKASLDRMDAHMAECFGHLANLGGGLSRMDDTLDRIEARLTRIENHPRLAH